jgi:SAM-dependent methyltransferase
MNLGHSSFQPAAGGDNFIEASHETGRERHAVLVLGMHRSGTSALAGTVHFLGAAAPKSLMPPMANNNPRGFWESSALLEVHDGLLASAGSYWHDWRPLDPSWFQSAEAANFREKIKRVILDEFGGHKLLVVKDPRACRFSQFLTSIMAEMEIEPTVLLPIRNPLEVAYSLKRRDNITLSRALLIWLRNVLDAEHDTRGARRCFISYEKMLTDWRGELGRATKVTGSTFWAASSNVDGKVDAYLAQELRHERATLADLAEHPDVFSWIRDAYRILSTFCSEGEAIHLFDQLDRTRAQFDEAIAVFAKVMVAQEDSPQREVVASRSVEGHSRSELPRLSNDQRLAETASGSCGAEPPVSSKGDHPDMPQSITDSVAGHRAKYNHLASHLSAEEAAVQFVGGGDPVTVGFAELEALRKFKEIKGAAILDIGCGIGRLTKYLFDENVSDYLGLDIIPEILQKAIDASKDHANFRFAIVEDGTLPAAAASFDIVCGFSLITHLIDEEIFEYFSEAKRVLRARGVAIFSFADLDIPQVRATFFRHAKQHRHGHGELLRFTTRPILRYFAEGAGFSSVTFTDGSDNVVSATARPKLIDGRDAPRSYALGESLCVMTT